jgi:hypothetical protein
VSLPVPVCAPQWRGERFSPPRAPFVSRALATALVVALLPALTAAAPSRADGDPASDYLLLQNIFVPYQAPSPDVTAALEHAADAVYLRGERVKVAVIYDTADLGSLPSLFGNPSDYARYLGIELSLWYAGPLLVVMPAGFGIYDGGRSTEAESRVLQSIPVAAGSPDDLVRTATTAVTGLLGAGALASPDIRAPLVTTHPASARRGKQATLQFDVFDDSGRSKATVRVYELNSLLATLVVPPALVIGTRKVELHWLVPAELRSRQLHFCVIASDPAGNRSKPACAPFLDVR